MKVKLLKIYGESNYDSYKETLEDSTDWEEITEQEAQEVQKAIDYKNSKYGSYRFVLIYDTPIKKSTFSNFTFIEQVNAEQKAEKAANEKYIKEQKRLKDERDRKNKENREATLLKKKQKLEAELEKLKLL